MKVTMTSMIWLLSSVFCYGQNWVPQIIQQPQQYQVIQQPYQQQVIQQLQPQLFPIERPRVTDHFVSDNNVFQESRKEYQKVEDRKPDIYVLHVLEIKSTEQARTYQPTYILPKENYQQPLNYPGQFPLYYPEQRYYQQPPIQYYCPQPSYQYYCR